MRYVGKKNDLEEGTAAVTALFPTNVAAKKIKTQS